MGHFQETESKKLGEQRRKFLWLNGIISIVAICFCVATIVLAILMARKYPATIVRYHVWAHSDANLGSMQPGIDLKVPRNSTLFTIMEHAAKASSRFKFEYSHSEYGRYITSIGGVKERPDEQMYWMVYQLEKDPNPKNPPEFHQAAELGVDSLRADKDVVYLFWLTKYDTSNAKEFEGRRVSVACA